MHRAPARRTPPRLAQPTRSLAPLELDARVRHHLRPVAFGPGGAPLRGRVYEIRDWKRWPIARQVAFIRLFIETSARDPHLADLAVGIFRAAGVDHRSHERQWAALLTWVQRNVYYVNEKEERLQSPQFTLTRGFGDCDDLDIVLLALGEAVRLPWRIVISGHTRVGRKVRWIEGSGPVPRGVAWTHIYGLAGWPPFRPSEWRFMEPTLPVPFGWDVIQGEQERARGAGRSGTRLPELGGTMVGLGETAPSVPAAPPAPGTFARPLRFVIELPWTQILVATIPTVLSAWWIGRFMQRQEEERGCVRRAS